MKLNIRTKVHAMCMNTMWTSNISTTHCQFKKHFLYICIVFQDFDSDENIGNDNETEVWVLRESIVREDSLPQSTVERRSRSNDGDMVQYIYLYVLMPFYEGLRKCFMVSGIFGNNNVCTSMYIHVQCWCNIRESIAREDSLPQSAAERRSRSNDGDAVRAQRFCTFAMFWGLTQVFYCLLTCLETWKYVLVCIYICNFGVNFRESIVREDLLPQSTAKRRSRSNDGYAVQFLLSASVLFAMFWGHTQAFHSFWRVWNFECMCTSICNLDVIHSPFDRTPQLVAAKHCRETIVIKPRRSYTDANCGILWYTQVDCT